MKGRRIDVTIAFSVFAISNEIKDWLPIIFIVLFIMIILAIIFFPNDPGKRKWRVFYHEEPGNVDRRVLTPDQRTSFQPLRDHPCPTCNQPLAHIEKANMHFCRNCQNYVEIRRERKYIKKID